VLLHGLAVLGLRPTDDWLRLAVTAAGEAAGDGVLLVVAFQQQQQQQQQQQYIC
jgi:hypothetical protein